MRISELKGDPGAKQKRKRIGRGEASGTGKTSGRGHKGQRSRKSGNSRPGFEGGQMPLQRRVPKRGFTNMFRKEFEIINIATIEERFEKGDVVSPETLKKKRMIKNNNVLVNILGKGAITKKVDVKANAFSKSAMEKITQQGGTCEVL